MALALLAALALSAAGGAHRLVRPDLAALTFTQSFGAAAEICGAPANRHSAAADCPVCHLVGVALLPKATGLAQRLALDFTTAAPLPEPQRTADTPLNPAHRLRAPPLI